MPRTATAATKGRPAIETKALAAESKSAGMRTLFDAGYKVAAVAKVFEAPYGFAYGVALRHGVAESAAARKGNGTNGTGKQASKPAKPAKRTSAPVARSAKATPAVKITKVASRTTKVARPTDKISATARVAQRIAAKKAGRPSPERRAANRKVRAAKG